MNAAVIGVSVDPATETKAMWTELGLSFPILADVKRDVVDAYGVRDPSSNPFLEPNTSHPNIAIASTFVIDPNGVLSWKHIAENTRDRPSTADLLQAVAAANGAS